MAMVKVRRPSFMVEELGVDHDRTYHMKVHVIIKNQLHLHHYTVLGSDVLQGIGRVHDKRTQTDAKDQGKLL